VIEKIRMDATTKSRGASREPPLGALRLRALPACLLALLPLSRALGQENQECLDCHSKVGLKVEREGREISLYVDPDRFRGSVHAALDCVACHFDLGGVEKYPHAAPLEPVECTDCHDDDAGPIATFRSSTHGRLLEAGNELAPRCQDCHGSHYVTRLSDPSSAISPANVPSMCVRCHAQGAPVARAGDLSEEQVFERYPEDIHGEGLRRKGLLVTAVCTSCHTGHGVLPHTDPASSIHADNVRATCMACHGKLEQVHRGVIADELWETNGSLPVCVDCHAPHESRAVSYGTNMGDVDCLRCHTDPRVVSSADGRSLFVAAEEHAGSVHARHSIACAQCHSGAMPSDERSCSTIRAPVNCAICHAAEVADYDRGWHGKLRSTGDANAPYCTDCHGRHDVLEHRVPAGATPELAAAVRGSPTYGRNVPALCGRCHREGAPAAQRYLGPESRIIEHYAMSIHGEGLLESGLTVTATCTTCHTPHRELPASDPESTVHESNIAATCGECHDGIYEQFQLSVHSREGNPDYVQLRGTPPLPHCNDCHSSHTMARTDLPEFKLSIVEQCGRCHEEITRTYFETYHGKASALGDATKAKCYDCHGAHEILPAADPASRLHADNIVATCAQCHPGAHRRFTGYLTHATHHDRERYPGLFYAFWGMTALLVSVFLFFGVHMIAWLPRSWKLRKQHRAELAAAPPEDKHYQRFSRFDRGLHLTVVLSFFGLAITGMMLKFSYTPWAQALSKALGGAVVAGWIHRVCAVATFGYMGAHLWDVARRFRRSKKTAAQFLFGPDSLVPRLADVREFAATLKWFIGKGPRPRYGRWTYWEKFDYFAVFWGVALIGVTGLCLWFPVFFTRFVPGWAINVATIIHSDEALLATGFIFTIHFFNSHFRPEKFPMDPVIFTGRMDLRELKQDRPALYDELVASGELEKSLVAPAPDLFGKGVRVFAYGALFVGLTLVVLILYALVFA